MSTPGYFTRLLRGTPTNANRATNARTINARRLNSVQRAQRAAALVASRKRKPTSRSRSRSTKRARS
jgi:hypothetical protein